MDAMDPYLLENWFRIKGLLLQLEGLPLHERDAIIASIEDPQLAYQVAEFGRACYSDFLERPLATLVPIL